MLKLVLATNNQDKVKELQAVLGDTYELVARPKELAETIEDGDTLEYNAIKKAREVCDYTGHPALADDSGIFVDALNGEPGVYSARYAGEDVTYEDNVNKMLAEMSDVPKGERGAQFRTAIAYVAPGAEPVVVEGVMGGVIDVEKTGDGGFGYDPIFIPSEGDGRSYAALSTEEKNAISHRTKAVTAMIGKLQ